MCKDPILATIDFTKTFIMEFNASRIGIGVVLMQEGRPLSFNIYQIKGNNLHNSIYEKEMFSILHEIKQWHPYLIVDTSR